MKYPLLLVLLCVSVVAATATSLEEVETICAACGTQSTQVVVVSTNTFGSPDLDLRPPEMMRSTMRYWVQQCPSCGYCDSDIGKLAANAEVTVKTSRYIDTLGDEGTDILVRRFLCSMQIMDGAGEGKAAIHAAICASWACDDAGDAGLGREIRRLIVQRLDAMREAGETYIEQSGGDALMACDIARRAGDFTRAAAYARSGIALKPEEIIDTVLHYELELIARRDTAVHTVAEALGE